MERVSIVDRCVVLNPSLQRDLCLIFNVKRNGDRAAIWGIFACKCASPFRVFELSRASSQLQFPLSGSLACAACFDGALELVKGLVAVLMHPRRVAPCVAVARGHIAVTVNRDWGGVPVGVVARGHTGLLLLNQTVFGMVTRLDDGARNYRSRLSGVNDFFLLCRLQTLGEPGQ